MLTPRIIETDYLVIGSGIAGLYFAIHAAAHGSVTVVTKRKVFDGSTYYAQGGIAAVLGVDDLPASHVEDTLRTGAGLCNPGTVERVVAEGPDRVRDLIENLGFPANRDAAGELDLGMEGGHSHRRIVHADDFTGVALMEHLEKKARSLPNVTLLENHFVVDLLGMAKYGQPNACFGAFVMDVPTGRIDTVLARATVLATGGAGKVYLVTSNPDTAVGDGIAMAYRVGAHVANMEFYQFHPTCFYHPQAKSFLISEALRGEGGILRRADGTAFMPAYHPKAELAPRDVVARAIDNELKRTGDDCAFLDMTHLDPEFLVKRFPNISAHCLQFGVDLRRQPIPVVPAAHYCCGGVNTDADGRSTVPGLFAIGETAHTGLHGACRLASNSLLEALVYAHRAAAAVRDCPRLRPPQLIPWRTGQAVSSDEGVVVTHNWDEIRRTMWNYVGIVRTEKRLARAASRIHLIREEIHTYYWKFLVTPELIELRNLALVADLICFGARGRQESRGLHYNLDFPERSPFYERDTVLVRGTGPDHG